MDEKRTEHVLRGLALGFDSSVGVVMPQISIDLPRIPTFEERLHSCFAHAIELVGVTVEHEQERETKETGTTETAGFAESGFPVCLWEIDEQAVRVRSRRRKRRKR